MRGLLRHWTKSSIIPSSKGESVWRNKRPKKRTVSFEVDRLPTWSTITSGSLEPMILSKTTPTCSLLFFEMMIFRNSILSGTEFYLELYDLESHQLQCLHWCFLLTSLSALRHQLILLWDLWCFWTSLTGRPVLSEIWETLPKTETIRSVIPVQTNHPISILCPERWFQILLNFEKQQFVSCTSNLLEQTYDFQRCTMFRQKWI